MILCVGQIVADVVVRPVDALPPAGTTVPVAELEFVAGGCAANTACVLAKLGSPTAIAGLVGQDSLANAILGEIAACGVDVSRVGRSGSVPTSAVIVIVAADGQRSFLYRSGGNEAFTASQAATALGAGFRHVHLGGALKLVSLDLDELLSQAKRQGATASLDTDWDTHGRWMRRLAPALPHLDYLFTNEEEGAQLTGHSDPRDIARSLLADGPRAVIVKRGEQGALLATPRGMTDFPAHRVDVLDTTCAGDSFVAGCLHGLHSGWDLERSVRFANAAGALCTTQLSHRAITSSDVVSGLARQVDQASGIRNSGPES